MTSTDLHIFVFPFLLKGHLIPSVDLAKLLASRGVRTTVIATTATAPQIQPTINLSPYPIQLLTLPFSTADANLIGIPMAPEANSALKTLQLPLKHLIQEHKPDCIVSDVLFTWTADLAAQFNIPRIGFHGTSSFTSYLMGNISNLSINNAEDSETFVLPGFPHEVEILKSQLFGMMTLPVDMMMELRESYSRTYGTVMNTFYELESDYIAKSAGKVWHVGPLSLCCPDESNTIRGGKPDGKSFDDCLKWLNSKKPRSVVYVCFGSLGSFTGSQLREMALGLEGSNHPFIWVLQVSKDGTEMMPEGFEERVAKNGKGLVIKGWAPQTVVLNHPAVGGFMTHCGWNSCLEGACAGVQMITWPLFGDQIFNEKLLVNVLGIAVPVGVKVCSSCAEERSLVSGEDVKKAVNELMGSGEKSDERRKKANEIAEMAMNAVKEGGSSYNDLSSLIQELKEIKMARVHNQES